MMKINIYIYMRKMMGLSNGMLSVLLSYNSIVYDIVLYLFIICCRNENKQINMCI